MNTFNLIIVGYGGQGVLTLAEIIARAAFLENRDTKQAEVHGLAQRGGSLQCHLRIGKEVYSPLVRKGGADLIIALELLEGLRACYWANKKRTIMVLNKDIFSPFPFQPEKIKEKQVLKGIKKYTFQTKLISASEVLEKITQETAMVNTLILGLAAAKGLLPIKKKSILKAMKEKFGKRFWDLNVKIFELAQKF